MTQLPEAKRLKRYMQMDIQAVLPLSYDCPMLIYSETSANKTDDTINTPTHPRPEKSLKMLNSRPLAKSSPKARAAIAPAIRNNSPREHNS